MIILVILKCLLILVLLIGMAWGLMTALGGVPKKKVKKGPKPLNDSLLEHERRTIEV